MRIFGKKISTILIVLLMAGIGLYSYKIYEEDTATSREKAKVQKQAQTDSKESSWGNLFEKGQKFISDKVSGATNAFSKKPYLAIIMDDIAYPKQFDELQKLGLKITPSFFPVSYYSPETARLAAKSEFYMVHLPLEAMNAQSPKFEWMRVNMDISKIQEIIAKIKKDFPKLEYINNHTGSKFSSSFRDMQRLLYVMDLYGIDFVDSRTSANTQAPRIYEESKRPLLSRDVFLDNEQSVSYINYQISQAIETAKQKGYAIAICHPHSATFRALKEAKSTILNEVNLVYVKDLPIAKQHRPRLQIALDDKTKSKINPKLFEGIPDSRYANIDNTMFIESKREKTNPQITPANASPSVAKQAGFSQTPAKESEVAQMAKYNKSTKDNSIKSQAGILSTQTSPTNTTQNIALQKSFPTQNPQKPTPKPTKPHLAQNQNPPSIANTQTPQRRYTPPTPPKSKPSSICSGNELEAFVSGCANGGDMSVSAREYEKSQKNNQHFLNVSMCKDAGGKWQNGKCQQPKGAHSFSSQSISIEGF
ncbi:divergent polysaccharide deacetylase family protein [Helicobacter sp. T3_23-1059]